MGVLRVALYPGGPGRHSWGRPASQPMRLQQAQGSLCTFCLLSASCHFTCFSLAGCSCHAQGRTTGPLTGRWRAVIATSSSKWCTPGGGAWSGPAHRQGGWGLQEVLAMLMQQMAFQCRLLHPVGVHVTCECLDGATWAPLSLLANPGPVQTRSLRSIHQQLLPHTLQAGTSTSYDQPIRPTPAAHRFWAAVARRPAALAFFSKYHRHSVGRCSCCWFGLPGC